MAAQRCLNPDNNPLTCSSLCALARQVDWDKWVDEDEEDEKKDDLGDLGDLQNLSKFGGGMGGMPGMPGMGGMGGMAGAHELFVLGHTNNAPFCAARLTCMLTCISGSAHHICGIVSSSSVLMGFGVWRALSKTEPVRTSSMKDSCCCCCCV